MNESDKPMRPKQSVAELWFSIRIGMGRKEVEKILGQPVVVRELGDSKKCVYAFIECESTVKPNPFEYAVTYDSTGIARLLDDPFKGKLSADNFPRKPRILVPLAEAVFEFYPRFLDVRWTPSAGYLPIKYEVALYLGREDGSISKKAFDIVPVGRYLHLCYLFPGAQRGAVRVRGVNGCGAGPWSHRRIFEFKK